MSCFALFCFDLPFSIMQLMIKLIRCRMDSLPHQWNETKKKSSKSHIHFWWLLIKWPQHEEMWLLKSCHMSAVKAPWLCDLWEDLFAAALWDYRELLNCSISVFWISNLAKGAISPPDMTYLKKKRELLEINETHCCFQKSHW